MARRNLAALTSPSSSPSSAPWSQIFQVIFGRIFSNCLLHLHQYNYLHKNPHIFITNYWNIFTRFWILELQICCSVYSSLRVRLYAEYLVYDTICFSPLRLASCFCNPRQRFPSPRGVPCLRLQTAGQGSPGWPLLPVRSPGTPCSWTGAFWLTCHSCPLL